MQQISSFHEKDVKRFDASVLVSLQLTSTSKGNQLKWYDPAEDLYVKGQFVYQGVYWKDYLVEVISSKIAKQMNLFHTAVVEQKECLIDTKERVLHGVYSRNFAKDGAQFISIKRLEPSIEYDLIKNSPIEIKWDKVLMVVKDKTGLDYENYLIVMSIIDYLVGNEDRHLNNFGVLLNSKFREAPLFDFGLGLFEHDLRYQHENFRKCLELMDSKPFARDNQEVIEFLDHKYNLASYLPECLDFTGTEIPSPKAESYLLNRCKLLGVETRGII